MKKNLEQIAIDDGRFPPGAIRFVYEGLGYTVKNLVTEPGHVTGRTLAKGLAKLALEKWGRLAMTVLGNWGIKTTSDFGQIVYLMIEYNWMSTLPADKIEDFDNIYDFKTIFKDNFKF